MIQPIEIAFFTDDMDGMAALYGALLGSEPAARCEGMAIFLAGTTKLFIHRNYVLEPG